MSESEGAKEGQTEPEARAVPINERTSSADAKGPVAQKLTPEEQMALFEKELKENDWGHQPC